jgi:hypothetical protein
MASPLKSLFALVIASSALADCVTAEQVAQMPDGRVCEGALAWSEGGPVYADFGYRGMFAAEAAGRNLSISYCANMLLAALENVADRDICRRPVAWSWSAIDQVPYWTNYAGIHRYVARSRGFQPVDCHDSNFECLDHGFERGSDNFKQCRLRLIVADRKDARFRAAIAAATAVSETAFHNHYRNDQLQQRRDQKNWPQRYRNDERRRDGRARNQRRAHRSAEDRGDLSLSNHDGEGPLEKLVKRHRARPKAVQNTKPRRNRRTAQTAKTEKNPDPPSSAKPTRATAPHLQSPIVKAALEALKKARAAAP